MEKTPFADAPTSAPGTVVRRRAPQVGLFEAVLQEEALRDVYLQRLERLVQLRQRHYYDLNEQGLRLLDHSIFAAYCDCRDLGAEENARGALREADTCLDEPAHPPREGDGRPGA